MRQARLFDDEPIPPSYLSLTAGQAGERDGRLVVHGLTDREAALIFEQMRKVMRSTLAAQTAGTSPVAVRRRRPPFLYIRDLLPDP